MRLEEWQKYIEAQFLDDEPENDSASVPELPSLAPAVTHVVILRETAADPSVNPDGEPQSVTPTFTEPDSTLLENEQTQELTELLLPSGEDETLAVVVAESARITGESVQASGSKPHDILPEDYPAFLIPPIPAEKAQPSVEVAAAPSLPSPHPLKKKRSSARFASQAIAMHPVILPPDAPDKTISPAQAVLLTPLNPTFEPISMALIEEKPIEEKKEYLFGPPPDTETELPSFDRYLKGDRFQAIESETTPIGAEIPAPMPEMTADTGVYAGLKRLSDAASITTLSFEILSEPTGTSDGTDEGMVEDMSKKGLKKQNARPVPETKEQAASAAPAMLVKTDSPTSLLLTARRSTRARHARNVRPHPAPTGLTAAELWASVPRHVQTLLALERQEEGTEVAQSSYKRPFQETRRELIERLLDPILSLEEAARLLNVCPTTVRRYTNKNILTYYRKEPQKSSRPGVSTEKETRQRRFRLSDILTFLETQQAALASDVASQRTADQALHDTETVIPGSNVSTVCVDSGPDGISTII